MGGLGGFHPMLRTTARALVATTVAVMLCAVFLACGRGKTPAPPETSPVTLEAALANKFVKSGASHTMVARIGLAAKKRSATQRPPVNLVLLVDTSGSMEGKAIADARAASLALLDSLTKEDRFGVVVFDSKAEVLLPSTKLDDADVKELRAKIGAMKANGTTDMTAGLRLAIHEVSRSLEKEGVNRIVLVGDGVPNDDRQVLSLVGEATAKGVSITSLGLGNDYDETLMGRIAQQSGGRFFYVEDSAKVASFFAEEVTRLHKVVARNAVLEIKTGPGIAVQSVVGRPMRTIEHGVSVNLGDMSLGEQQEIVVELAGTPAKDGSNVEVLDAVLHFEDGVGGATREERIFVGAKSTSNTASLADGKNKDVEDAFLRAKDAAATLDKIEADRRKQNAQNRAPAPPKPGAKAAMDLDEDKRAAPAAATPTPAQANEQRAQHDRAIRNFQAF